MGIFSWLNGIFSTDFNSTSISNDEYMTNINSDPIGEIDDFSINPANGLPMIGGIGGIDVEGNLFCTDFHHDHMTQSSFDDSFSSDFDSSFLE